MQSFIKRIIIFVLVFVALLLSAVTFARSLDTTDEASSSATIHTLRIQAIQALIASGFSTFQTMPMGPGSDFLHLT